MNAPQQLSLVPIKVTNLIPKHDVSADCQTYCEANDGYQYAVKQVSDSRVFPFTPFDELFCYELARLCEIAVPQYSLLEMPDKTLAFGSVWEGGAVQDGMKLVFQDVMQGGASFMEKQKLIERLSSIFAFDLFVHNEDRHDGNYLIRPAINAHVLIAMDFSRSWTNLNCPIDRASTIMNPPIMPMLYVSPPHATQYNGQVSNTYRFAKIFWNNQRLGQISGGAFFRTLERLLGIERERIDSILSKVPDSWCSPARKTEILNWWCSSERIDRINHIKGAYQNGLLV
jgi:hypothetical protein